MPDRGHQYKANEKPFSNFSVCISRQLVLLCLFWSDVGILFCSVLFQNKKTKKYIHCFD